MVVKILRSEALTCGPPKLDDDDDDFRLDPNLGPISSYFYRSPGVRAGCPGGLRYADVDASMYLRQINRSSSPGRPSQALGRLRQAQKQGRPWPGRVELHQKRPFQNSSYSGADAATAPGPSWLLWLLCGCCCWLLARRREGESQPNLQRRGQSTRSFGQEVELKQGTEGLSPPSRGRFISCGGSRDGPCCPNNYWPWRSGARPRVLWFSQSRLHLRGKSLPTRRVPLLVSIAAV